MQKEREKSRLKKIRIDKIKNDTKIADASKIKVKQRESPMEVKAKGGQSHIYSKKNKQVD